MSTATVDTPQNQQNTQSRTGSRPAIPADAMRKCPSCGQQRGGQRKGWAPIERAGQVVGYSCPACPADSEPIRRETLADGRTRFRATVVVSANGQRQQRRRRFDTLTAARDWVTEARAAMRGQTAWVDPSRWTVAELCEKWIAHRRGEVATGGLRISTLHGYSSMLASLLGVIGGTPARELRPSDVEAALRALAMGGGHRGKPMSHRSLTAALTALRQAYRHGQREQWVSSNPAQLARVPASQRRLPDDSTVLRWTPGELARFRDQLANHDGWMHVGMLLTLSGLRRSEVLGLDWANVDLDSGAVHVVASRTTTGRGHATTVGAPKSAASRRRVQVGAIHDGFVHALRVLWMQQGRPTTGLVIADADGPIRPERFSRTFDRIAAGAGLPTLARIHNVRHSLGLALQDAGVSDNRSAALLGHSVSVFRAHYLPTDDDAAAIAAETVRGLFAVN